MTLMIFLVLFLLIFLEVPIGWSIALTGLFYVLNSGAPMTVIPQTMFSSIDSFTLVSVPLFIASGAVMARGGLSEKIVNIAYGFVGHLNGGFASSGAVACGFFGAISGSANATAAAIGGVVLPEMEKKGYDKRWSTAFMACAAIVGVLIPPSIPLVLYGAGSATSIGKLFLGAITPGVLIVAGLCFMAYRHSKQTGEGTSHDKFSIRRTFTLCKEGALALGMPIIILGGVFTGIFTANEAAGIGLFYGIIVSMFVYKQITFNDLIDILGDAFITTATIMLILMGAGLFGWIVTSQSIPKTVVVLLTSITSNPLIIMMILNVFFLILGTFFETCAAIIILTPIVAPTLAAFGIDPVYFGVVMITNLAIGMVTPPLGVVLYVSSGISNIAVNETFRPLTKIIAYLIFVLILITVFPSLCTWLPNLLFK